MEKKKRVRGANFTAEEVRLLIRLALEVKHILENKQTDSEILKLKSETWERIAAVFIASAGQTFRSVDTWKLKYDGLKKELKKKVNENKAETMKTGGGHLDYIVIDGPEKELLEVLSLSVHKQNEVNQRYHEGNYVQENLHGVVNEERNRTLNVKLDEIMSKQQDKM
ncbi:hypothetical protein JTB14_032196 [Gonioctena quinquepunctata]|nr:hypothetical protein JTB14_032196 [Gonioctena quinquepunctata]